MKYIALFLMIFVFLNNVDCYIVSAEASGNSFAMYLGSNKTIVNDEIVDIDDESSSVFPLVRSNKIFVPLRFVLEQFGGNVSWSPNLKMVSIQYRNSISQLTLGSEKTIINNKECALSNKTQLISNRMFISIEDLEEILTDKDVVLWGELILIKNKDSISINTKNPLTLKSWLSKFAQDDNPLFPVLIDNKWGYINKEGKVAIEPVFSKADFFSEGLALVKYENECGFINKSGKIIFTVESLNKYCKTAGFSEGLVGVWDLGWGYDYCTIYDTNGKIVGGKDSGSLIYSDAGGYSSRDYFAQENCYYNDGLIPMRFDYGLGGGYYRFLNKEGKSALNCKFYEARNFSEGLAAVRGIYNLDDEELKKSKYPYDLFREDSSNLQKSGFIDFNGEFVIPLNEEFENAYSFSEGLAAVKVKDKGWGYINKSGKIIIQPIFIMVADFYDGLALVRDKNGKCGYIDKNGNYVIEPIYDQAESFSEGLAAVGKSEWGGTLWGYINKKGEAITDFIYGNVAPFHNGLARVYKPLERETDIQHITVDYDKFIYINKDGNTVWKFMD